MNEDLTTIQKTKLWLLTKTLQAMAVLPQTARLRLGGLIGQSARSFAFKRRGIMQHNLELAFPESDQKWRNDIIASHFKRLGEDAFESVWGWYGKTKTPPPHQVIGLEHILAARARGQGIILNAGHFTPGDFAVYLGAQHWPIHAVYRPNNNPIIDELINRGRRKHVVSLIDRKDTRGMIRCLKKGGILWTAADQSYHGKQSAYLPFFGIPCATNTAVPALARASSAVVLPYFVRRNGGNYTVVIHPPCPNVPSGDDAQDTERLARILEHEIRLEPNAYLWGHRRYKDKLLDSEP